MEVIDIGLGDLDPTPITLKLNDDDNYEPKSVNFGGGIEMFMNDDQRSSGKQVNVDFSDLDKLENQLNQLSSSQSGGGSLFGETTKSISGMASSLFGLGGSNSASASASSPSDGYEKTDSKL